MIKNERQYRITRAEAEKFEDVFANLEAKQDPDVDPVVREAEIAALRSQLRDLQLELSEYEELQAGTEPLIEVHGIEGLPLALIKARIAAGLSQKELGERLGLKEQQIQRYEATDYAGASVARLRDVAQALGVHIKKSLFLPRIGRGFDVFKRLRDIGLDKDFVVKRLIPRGAARRFATSATSDDPELVFEATASASHIYGWTPAALIGTGQLFVDQGVLGAARFKVTEKAEHRRLSAYTFYAHFLALHLLEAAADLPCDPVPTSPDAVRTTILANYGEMCFENALRYVWDLGIPVLPLNDAGAFHGAIWRVAGRNIIVLKQQTNAVARWLHDLLHELWHAGEEPGQPERSVIEAAETSQERRESDEELRATEFAADVVLAGRAEEFTTMCVEATKATPQSSGRVERLKAVVPDVAAREGVPADSLANYLAFRLSLQGIDWWGTAQNLQRTDENPWSIARDVLLERATLGRLSGLDRQLLMLALSDPEE